MNRVNIAICLTVIAIVVALGTSSDMPKKRAKRSFAIFRGTKWCGKGNKARHYNDLGTSRVTDMCCRTHDHCRYNIKAFTIRWYLLNSSPSAWSHCDCDVAFYYCLIRAYQSRAPGAKEVGYAYFNWFNGVIKCFRFHRWWSIRIAKRFNTPTWYWPRHWRNFWRVLVG